VTLTYDAGATASDRLKELTSHISTEDPLKLVQSVQDNAAGQVTGRALNNGLIAETRAFNSRNQLARIAAAANSATLLDMSYGYGSGNDGRIRSRTDAVQPEHSASYTFDAIGRLTAVSGGDSSWGIAWTLDQYGNRTTQTPTGLASSRLGSPSLTYTDNKVSGLGYDAAGNMTNDGVGGHNYTYDAENRLIQVDSGAIQYAYDYAGRRIKKTSSGVSTYYFYGLTGLTSEFSTSTTQSEVTQAATTDRFQYRIGEQTGTAVMLVGSDGTPRENNRVFPFGEPWLSFEASNNSEKFTTYQHDGESGLEYAMARYYAGGSGRFMTPDPGHVGANVGDPQSWNAYVYALNDPINSSDPSGLDPSCYVDGIEADCGLASNLLSTGAAEQCPNNLCSFSLMGQYYRYFAAAGGASGYVNFMDLPYLYEWNGHLLDTRVDRAVAQGNLGQANNLTVEQRLNNAYPVAMAALTRQSCSSLFVGRSPADALIDLFFWGESFRWDEGNLGLGPNSAAATTTLLPAYRMGPAGRTFSGSFYNLITFSNNRAGSFMTGSAMDNANTLLHELAHGYNNLRASGLSAPLILNDGFGVPNGVQNSIRNRDTIAMNCFNP
jgi:RHS repeat-associated protein